VKVSMLTVVSCRIVSCRVVSCRIVSCRVVLLSAYRGRSSLASMAADFPPRVLLRSPIDDFYVLRSHFNYYCSNSSIIRPSRAGLQQTFLL